RITEALSRFTHGRTIRDVRILEKLSTFTDFAPYLAIIKEVNASRVAVNLQTINDLRTDLLQIANLADTIDVCVSNDNIAKHELFSFIKHIYDRKCVNLTLITHTRLMHSTVYIEKLVQIFHNNEKPLHFFTYIQADALELQIGECKIGIDNGGSMKMKHIDFISP
ncbi:hypothetical protein PMAYCL1PPCAC_20488, partial [Pristionchus mayeri]